MANPRVGSGTGFGDPGGCSGGGGGFVIDISEKCPGKFWEIPGMFQEEVREQILEISYSITKPLPGPPEQPPGPPKPVPEPTRGLATRGLVPAEDFPEFFPGI